MFIQCSDCDYKYIVNSADLKPDGRMVECANCNHRWFQEPLKGEDLLSSSVPKTFQEKPIVSNGSLSLREVFSAEESCGNGMCGEGRREIFRKRKLDFDQ